MGQPPDISKMELLTQEASRKETLICEDARARPLGSEIVSLTCSLVGPVIIFV